MQWRRRGRDEERTEVSDARDAPEPDDREQTSRHCEEAGAEGKDASDDEGGKKENDARRKKRKRSSTRATTRDDDASDNAHDAIRWNAQLLVEINDDGVLVFSARDAICDHDDEGGERLRGNCERDDHEGNNRELKALHVPRHSWPRAVVLRLGGNRAVLPHGAVVAGLTIAVLSSTVGALLLAARLAFHRRSIHCGGVFIRVNANTDPIFILSDFFVHDAFNEPVLVDPQHDRKDHGDEREAKCHDEPGDAGDVDVLVA